MNQDMYNAREDECDKKVPAPKYTPIQAFNRDFFALVEKVFEEAREIRASRMDYNTSRPVTDYLLHGPQDFVYEIYKKALRADSLIKAKSDIGKIDDCMLDIINYAAYIMAAQRLKP